MNDLDRINRELVKVRSIITDGTEADRSAVLPYVASDCQLLAHEVADLVQEVRTLRLRLLSAAGDDLCRLTQEEIKAYTAGEVQIPPKEEFIASCERFHKQIAEGAGVLTECLTLAQLIAENAKLREQLAALEQDAARWTWCEKHVMFGLDLAGGSAWAIRIEATGDTFAAAVKAAIALETKGGE